MRRSLAILASIIPVWVLIIAGGGTLRAAESYRVALMNFATEENSFRSQQSALEFTAALQALISASAPEFTWVERAQLDAAEQELQLTAFGQPDRAATLRSGRWTKADWGIYGLFATNAENQRTLTLEIIDLRRADILQEKELTLTTPANAPVNGLLTELDAVAEQVQKLLEAAQQQVERTRGQPTVALLFVSTKSWQNWLSPLERELRKSLPQPVEGITAPRLLNFQRTGESLDEASLLFSDLTENNNDAWQKTADYYVWVTGESKLVHYHNQEKRRLERQQQVSLQMEIWDGRHDKQVFTLNDTNNTPIIELADRLATGFRSLLTNQPITTPAPQLRQQIADSVFQRAWELINTRRIDSRSQEERQSWLSILQLLETALLFDPGNALFHEWWTRVRWINRPYNYLNDGKSFAFDIGRSEGWGKYVDSFGLETKMSTPPRYNAPTNSITFEYISSALANLEPFRYNNTPEGAPRDIGGTQLESWEKQFTQELYERILKTKDRPELQTSFSANDLLLRLLKGNNGNFLLNGEMRSRSLEVLWPLVRNRYQNKQYIDGSNLTNALTSHFRDLKQPGNELKLLAEVGLPDFTKVARRYRVTNTTGKVKLPRLSTLVDRQQQDDIFALPDLHLLPTIVNFSGTAHKLAFDMKVNAIVDTAAAQGKIWLIATCVEDLVSPQRNRNEREQERFTEEVNRLFLLNNIAKKPERITGPLRNAVVNDMLMIDDTLWLALDEGIARLDLITSELTQFSTVNGLTATNYHTLTATKEYVFAIGGAEALDMYDLNRHQWAALKVNYSKENIRVRIGGKARRLTSSSTQLLYCNHPLFSFDPATDTWTRWDEQIAQTYPPYAQFFQLMTSDHTGQFWLGGTWGLVSFDAATKTITPQYVNLNPIIRKTVAAPHRHLFEPEENSTQISNLKTFRQIESHLAAREKSAGLRATNQLLRSHFEPVSRTPGEVIQLAADDQFLWVLTRPPSNPRGSCLAAYDPVKNVWRGRMIVSGAEGTFQTILVDETTITITWKNHIGGFELATIPKAPFLDLPKDQWSSHKISVDEKKQLIKALSPHEQGVYHFFVGEFSKAVKILEAELTKERNPEALFLLAKCHDAIGLNQPELEQKYLSQLKTTAPNSVFSRYLGWEAGIKDVVARSQERQRIRLAFLNSQTNDISVRPNPFSRTSGEARFNIPARTNSLVTSNQWVAFQKANTNDSPASILKDFDANQNGSIETDEFEILLKHEPWRVQNYSPHNTTYGGGPSISLFSQADRNHNSILDQEELMTLILKRPEKLRSSPRVPNTTNRAPNRPVNPPSTQ